MQPTPGRLAAVTLVLAAAAAPAAADTFSGFSGVDRPYLVNQDRVCAPLAVQGGVATGAPRCEKAAADRVAKLSIKAPLAQRGARAAFAATASGATITVARAAGDPVVRWDAPDPVGKIVDVFASEYEDRVAVAYTVRRVGREVTDVVAFDLGRGHGQGAPPQPAVDPATATSSPPDAEAHVDEPKVAALVKAARGAAKAKTTAAWQAVLAADVDHAEARFHVAALAAAAGKAGDALAALRQLAASRRPDAIEWLVEARRDPAFAALRADATFRAAVGLDAKAHGPYARLMGFGGQWEQTGTSCDKPEVRLTFTRERTFKLKVKTTCEGNVYDSAFKGRWRLAGGDPVLILPSKGKPDEDFTCGFEAAGDEDALRCKLDDDLEFVVLPTRR